MPCLASRQGQTNASILPYPSPCVKNDLEKTKKTGQDRLSSGGLQGRMIRDHGEGRRSGWKRLFPPKASLTLLDFPSPGTIKPVERTGKPCPLSGPFQPDVQIPRVQRERGLLAIHAGGKRRTGRKEPISVFSERPARFSLRAGLPWVKRLLSRWRGRL